ncbi:MAG: hemolysin family protein [Phycisphaerae bacterium]
MIAVAELPVLAASTALLLSLIALSACFSGSEAILFSQTRAQLQANAGSPNPLRRAAAALLKTPKQTLSVILIGNTAVNLLFYVASYLLAERVAERGGGWITLGVAVLSMLLVIVFGEAIPKVVGSGLSAKLVAPAALFIRAAGVALIPAARMIDALLVEPLSRILFGRRRRDARRDRELSANELHTLLEMSRRHGVINPIEDVFLREVIDLGGRRVKDVMKPRVEVAAYDVNGPPEGLRRLMRRTRFKKIPVYDGSIDDIVGIVYAKILFFERNRPLRELVTPVRFVPELITCEQLLQHFRGTRSQIAIAVDEFGGMAGLVTLEDVLEEIVGELDAPEHAPREAEIVTLGEREYEISGRLSVHYWTDTIRIPRLSRRVATVGGLVTTQLGRPARLGDRVRLGNLELEVLAVDRRRVERLRLRLLDAAQTEPAA